MNKAREETQYDYSQLTTAEMIEVSTRLGRLSAQIEEVEADYIEKVEIVVMSPHTYDHFIAEYLEQLGIIAMVDTDAPDEVFLVSTRAMTQEDRYKRYTRNGLKAVASGSSLHPSIVMGIDTAARLDSVAVRATSLGSRADEMNEAIREIQAHLDDILIDSSRRMPYATKKKV